MKLEIDLSEIWDSENNESVKTILKREVSHIVVSELKKTLIDKSLNDFIIEESTKFFNGEVKQMISATIEEIRNRERLLTFDRESLTLDEFIMKTLTRTNGWNNIQGVVENVAKNFVTSVKKTYDTSFATTIVDNMIKQNLLKDDVVKALFNGVSS